MQVGRQGAAACKVDIQVTLKAFNSYLHCVLNIFFQCRGISFHGKDHVVQVPLS